MLYPSISCRIFSFSRERVAKHHVPHIMYIALRARIMLERQMLLVAGRVSLGGDKKGGWRGGGRYV